MEEDSDAFYVVRKGDVVGIYKSLIDCQAQVGSSVSDPSVSVYKGRSLQKETEKYLASRGLKDALYCMHAEDLKDDLFGTLVPCPFQQPLPFAANTTCKNTTAQKRSNEMDAAEGSFMTHQPKQLKLQDYTVAVAQPISKRYMTCILEFDGASKGNPGQAGAGAILRSPEGGVIARIREGLGIATNNVAEYRALILGMKYCLQKGFKQIQVQGDSKLVCMQVQDLWQTKNQNMAELCKEVKRLKQMFASFKINHVLREYNSDADAQANLGINLRDGEVYEECIDS